MNKQKEMTARNTSVGADDRQSLHVTNYSITNPNGNNTMLGQRSKICGKRYEAQLIVVGHFQNRDIYRCIDERYRLGKIAAKETSRACGKASKAVSEVCSYRLYKARIYKFDYEI